MKKVLTILVVLTLIAGAAFADGNKVTLTTAIDEIAPVFKLYYNDGDDLLTGTQEADGSIADGITANFEIWQEGEEAGAKTYSNYRSGAVVLTVTCGAFEGTDAGTTGYASAAPKASALVNGDAQEDDKGNDTLTYGASAGVGTATVTFRPTYYGKRVDDQKVASFTATWDAAPELPYGAYAADITLTYTASL